MPQLNIIDHFKVILKLDNIVNINNELDNKGYHWKRDLKNIAKKIII